MKKALFIISALAFASCEKKIETEYNDVPALRASMIYRSDSVFNYMEKYKDANKDLSESYLKRSKELESSDLSMAVYCSKRAITLYPEVNSYKYLASLLERTSDFQELNELYFMLTHERYIKDDAHPNGDYIYLFGKPDEDTFYEYMASEILSRDYLYAGIVYEARESGYDVNKLKERLFSDKRLKIDMTTPEAKNMMLSFMTEEELEAYNKLESTFKNMLASIKDVSPVFEINENNVHNFKYGAFNGTEENYDMEGITESYVMVNYLKEKRENPDNWYKYNFDHVINIGDSVKAVIYSIDSSATACPVEMRHIYHRLVTYNPKAEIISSQIVALQSGERLMTLNYNMDKFTVTEHKRSWKKPYEKEEFDNYITGIEKVKESSFEILPDGTIRAVTVLAAAQ
jgi:hypothetical protein